MPRTAKVFMTNRSQAVRLPKQYQFSTDEVFIRKEGEDVILSPPPRDWAPYFESAPIASGAFMDSRSVTRRRVASLLRPPAHGDEVSRTSVTTEHRPVTAHVSAAPSPPASRRPPRPRHTAY